MQHRFFERTPARRIALFLILALSLSSFALPPFGAFAQDEKENKKNEDRKKDKAKKSQEERIKSIYKRWKDEDVRWIITDEERKIFDSLKTDDEREQFIEGFWYRRDPDPDTDVNEYREEYYQRIAYANEHYTSGIPGWKTDRGRIYIMFGKADQIETHPSGGSYDRPAWEGGGTTSTSGGGGAGASTRKPTTTATTTPTASTATTRPHGGGSARTSSTRSRQVRGGGGRSLASKSSSRSSGSWDGWASSGR